MKKSFKLVSSLCVGLLAVGAGVALATNNVEAKQTDAASGTFIVIGDHQGSWNNTDDNFAMEQVDGQYEFKGIHWTSGQSWRITWAGEWGQYAGWSTLQNKEGMTDAGSDNNIKTTRDWYYDIYFKNTDGNKIYLANAAYSVTLNKDGGQVVAGTDITGYSYSDEKTLPTLAKDGYSFGGFFDNNQFTGSPVTKIESTDHGNKEYFAKFTEVEETYTVKFSANGGEGTMPDASGIPNEDYTIPASLFTLAGYKQVGWATSAEGDVEYTTTIPANTYEDKDEVTLYAVWEEVGEKEYHFTNNKGWADVYCHYWGSSTGGTEMPGEKCEFAYINENNENVYKVSVPEDVTGLIFNNNNQGLQTADITGDKLEYTAFYCSSDSSPYEVGTWDVAYNTVCYNLEGGTGTLPAEHQVYFHGKGLLVDDGSELTKDDQVFDKWVSSLQNPIITSYVGEDGNTYIDTTHEDLTADMRIELHATYKDAPMDEGYYLVGSMTEWVLDEEYLMTFNDEKNEYSIEHTFDLDDEFKIVHHTNKTEDVYYGYEVLEGGTNSAKDAGQIVNVTENGNMKVTYAGTYTPYFKANDTSIWISAIEETHVYQIKVNDTTYDLVANPGNPDEYMTASDVSLTSGDILAYYKDEALQTANPKAIGNNNCYSNEGVTTVCLNIESKIYVDIKANTIFCAGLDVNKFYMSVNNNPVDLKHNESPADPTFDEYYTTGYTFAYNDVIKFVDTKESNANAVVFKVLTVNESSTEGFEVVDEELLCTASEGKQTDVYVKFKSGADEVYFGDVAEDLAAAIKYAKAFNSALSSVCVAQGQTVVADLQAAWSAQASEFTSLIESARTILKNADGSHSNLDIKEFAQKYDYVYSHYSTQLASHGGNFIDRTPVEASPFVYGLTANNNTLITIVVICSVSSVTLLGVILLIKRRRNLVK